MVNIFNKNSKMYALRHILYVLLMCLPYPIWS